MKNACLFLMKDGRFDVFWDKTYLCVLVLPVALVVVVRVVIGALVGGSGRGGLGVLLSAWLLSDHVEHTVLQSLLVLAQPVLLPGVIVDVTIEVVSPHAVDEETLAGAIVGLLLEFETAAVLHELTELARMATAQLLKRRFNLLLLNRVVLFVLAATWQTLPWQRALNQV